MPEGAVWEVALPAAGPPSPPRPDDDAPPAPTGPLRSAFAGDAGMAELLGEFVGSLPEIVSDLARQLGRGDAGAARGLAHQLKGTGGGFGFAAITAVAARAEEQLREVGLGAARAAVDELMALVRSVDGYDAAREAAPVGAAAGDAARPEAV